MGNLPTPGPGNTNWGETLNNFLLTEHDPDGTHSGSASVATDWKLSGHSATRITATQFRISGADHTDIYANGRRAAFVSGASTYYATIKSSVYTGGNTDVTVDQAVVPAAIDTLKYSVAAPAAANGRKA